MEIKRRDFLKITGVYGIGVAIPFNLEESNPYNLWKPLPIKRLEKTESICPLCESFCKLDVYKKRENVFFFASGDKKGLCPKIFTYHNIIYNEKRIKTPLIRKGDRGKISFNPIDYDEAIKVLKEKYAGEKFYIDAFSYGEADRYFLSALSKKINFYPEVLLKNATGADRVYFDIEKSDLVLNFGGDIINYGNFIDGSEYLINHSKKIISFSPMVTRGTAFGEEWHPVKIASIPIMVSLIQAAIGKGSLPDYQLIDQSRLKNLVERIKTARKICVAFDPSMGESLDGINAINSVISLAKNLNSVNKDGGTYFYSSVISSKAFNILSEPVTNYLAYNLDPLIINQSADFEDRIKRIPFIVFVGSHHSEISKYADIILPATFFVEKDEVYLKRGKGGFSVLVSSPAIEGGAEAVELRKKENIEVIFQKLLNFKTPYGIKDISEIVVQLEPKVMSRKSYILSLAKGLKISQLNPSTTRVEGSTDQDKLSLYLYDDGIISFYNRGARWAEEAAHFNRALVNKRTAEKIGVKKGDSVIIKTEAGEIKVKVFIYEGIADNTLGLKRFKTKADINLYTNRNRKEKTSDKEVKQIWWEEEDINTGGLFKFRDNYGYPAYDIKIVSIKKA